jgi:hypothetical protein
MKQHRDNETPHDALLTALVTAVHREPYKSAALQAKWARNKSIAKWNRKMKKKGEIRK